MNTNEKNRYEEKIEETLRDMGLSKSYKGFEYLQYAVSLVLEDSNILTYICKGIYVDVAVYYQTTVSSVERNIRTAKEVIWKNCDETLLHSIFGNNRRKRIPQNAIFIDKLAYYIKSK